MDDVDRRYKATLFKHIFKETEPFLDLYEGCSGRRLSTEDITSFDLDSDVVQRERYNDVSFITNDNRLIYLVEHQSTSNANLAVKLGAYYFDLLKLWIEHMGVSIHTAKEVQFPKPELYAVYNGKTPYGKEYERYDCGEFMQINVPVIDIHYDGLKNKSADNYLTGYAYLQHEFECKQHEGWTDIKAFEYAVQQCKEKGFLRVEGVEPNPVFT